MLTGLFTLPSDFLTSTLGYIGSTLESVWPIVAIAIGVPLAFYIIRKVIAILGARAR